MERLCGVGLEWEEDVRLCVRILPEWMVCRGGGDGTACLCGQVYCNASEMRAAKLNIVIEAFFFLWQSLYTDWYKVIFFVSTFFF